MTEVLDRIRGAMGGLKMPRVLEALDHTMQKLEHGAITAIEAIDGLLSEDYSTRDTRRIDVALRTSKRLFERDGIDIDRSTLADWGGKSTALLEPLAPSH